MKKLTLTLAVVFLTTVSIMPAHSTMKKLAQTGLQFLKVDMSARAAAMGGAYLLVGKGANAMLYNPAGLAKMTTSFDFFASQTQWLGDIKYNAVGLAKNMQNWGSVGISAIYCDYGTIEGTQVSSNAQGYIETGNVDVGAFTVGLSYAKELTNKFSVGGQVKWVSQHLGESMLNDSSTVKNRVSGVAYDFGTIFYPGFKSFRFGMSIRNFSSELKYQQEGFQLPLTFSIGIAMDVLDFLGEHNDALTIAIDALHPRDYSERLHFGAEYLFRNMFALRAGYKMNYDEENLTLGIGFNYKVGGVSLKIDYAYASFGVFSSVNRFSVGFAF